MRLEREREKCVRLLDRVNAEVHTEAWTERLAIGAKYYHYERSAYRCSAIDERLLLTVSLGYLDNFPGE